MPASARATTTPAFSAPERPAWAAAATVAVVAFAARVAVVWQSPVPFSFDGFQRWAAREHLLVQDWLPATQALIIALAPLGLTPTRLGLAAVAALGFGALALVAGRMGGRAAGWLLLPVALYGPGVAWTTVLYQEGTFLAVAGGAMALALHGRERAADLVVGLLGLVRYEAWPCLLAWVAWRRDRRALIAGWGPALWLGARLFGAEGYAASPVDFADWKGLGDRFRLDAWTADVVRFLGQALATGALPLWAAAPFARGRGAGLLGAWFGLQLLATLAWIAGLETATLRMQVIPAALAGTLAAVAAGRAWARLDGTWGRPLLLVGAFAFAGFGLRAALNLARIEAARVRPEVEALDQLRATCPDCRWTIRPRRGLGTRHRHDGCEVLQGISTLRHRVDFTCEAWGDPADPGAGQITWTGRGYRVDPPREP